MTGRTPQISNTKYTLYKIDLNREEIRLILAYAKALKNKEDISRELQLRVWEIINRIRPRHIHNNRETTLRIRGYEILREYIKIRFTCSRCNRSVYLRIPIPADMQDPPASTRGNNKPIILKENDRVIYISREEYDVIRTHILNLRRGEIDPQTRREALVVIEKIRPRIAIDGIRQAMAVSSYKLYSDSIAIKFRSKRYRTTKTIYLKSLSNSSSSPALNTSKQMSILTELYGILKTYLARRRKKKSVGEDLKRKLRESIERIRPKHEHGGVVKLHIHGYYRTKSGDIVIRFRCPVCGRTESVRIPGSGKGKAELALKERFVIQIKNARCVVCGGPVVKNGSAKTKVKNLRIQQYRCVNPDCQRSFRATVLLSTQISRLFQLLHADHCDLGSDELEIAAHRRQVALARGNRRSEISVKRKIPVLRTLLADNRHKSEIRLFLFALVDAVALIFAEKHGLPFEFIESVGNAARKYISGLSYTNLSALLFSPMPLHVFLDSVRPIELFRSIYRLHPSIARALVNFSAELAYGLLSRALALDPDMLSFLYVVDSTVQIIAGPYVMKDSSIRFHLAVSLPFLIIDDVLFGNAQHEFRLFNGAIGEIADREYAVRAYAGRALRAGVVTIIRPRGDAPKFDLLVVNKYLFERFGRLYYLRWIVEPTIGYASGRSDKAVSRLFRTAMAEICIRCFVWNVFLIGLVLHVLSHRLHRGLFDVLFDFFDADLARFYKSAIKLYRVSSFNRFLKMESCVFCCGVDHSAVMAS